ncbi:FtsX-like permease family protein [Actinoallomurus sp. NPDC052308]|uniref:ABC transporter permease n=1 Tax=Actinoallomurus sp. NPDC052308 TaxID=3155530 RepID=UPI0034178D98
MTVLDLAWKMIRAHRGGLMGAFVALLGASALITACGIILQSGLSAGVAPQRYAGAAVVVGGPTNVAVTRGGKTKHKPLTERATLPTALVDRVAHVQGVRAAIGDVSFPAEVIDRKGEPVNAGDGSLGHGWASAALTPLTPAIGRPPASAGEVVLDAVLARRARVTAGDRVKIMAGGAPATYQVSGVTARHGADRHPALFFSDAEAERFAGRPGTVDAIGVLTAPHTDTGDLAARIGRALRGTRANVTTGAARSRVEFPDVRRARSDLQEMAGALTGTIILVTVLVVAGTLALTFHRRRREIALLRAIAATPRQISKMIAAEMLVVSLVAAALGWLPGVVVAFALKSALGAVGLIPADYAFSAGPLPALVALGACVGVAELAAWAASRRAVRVRPVEALGEAALERRGTGGARVAAGLGLLLIGGAASLLPLFFGSVFAVAGAGSGGLIMIIAVVLLGPPVVKAMTRLLAVPLRRSFGTPGYLAAAGARASSRRLAAAISPMILIVGFALIQLGLPTIMAAAAHRDATRGVLADRTLARDGGVPPDALDAARNTPGVLAATPIVHSTIYAAITMLGDPEVFEYQAQGIDPRGLDRTLDLGVQSGNIGDLAGGTVAISRAAAGTLGARVGSTVRLYLGDGTPVTPRVIAVYRRGAGFGDITLPHPDLLPHTTRRIDETILVRARPGTSLGELERRYPGLTVHDRDGIAAAQRSQQNGAILTSALPLLMIFGYIAVAVANALVLSVTERTREFALLRLVGATHRQIMRMMRAEAVLVAVIAVAIGTAVPLLPLATIGYGLTGNPMPYLPPLLYVAITGGASLLGTLSILVPARIALRSHPKESL